MKKSTKQCGQALLESLLAFSLLWAVLLAGLAALRFYVGKSAMTVFAGAVADEAAEHWSLKAPLRRDAPLSEVFPEEWMRLRANDLERLLRDSPLAVWPGVQPVHPSVSVELGLEGQGAQALLCAVVRSCLSYPLGEVHQPPGGAQHCRSWWEPETGGKGLGHMRLSLKGRACAALSGNWILWRLGQEAPPTLGTGSGAMWEKRNEMFKEILVFPFSKKEKE